MSFEFDQGMRRRVGWVGRERERRTGTSTSNSRCSSTMHHQTLNDVPHIILNLMHIRTGLGWSVCEFNVAHFKNRINKLQAKV